MNFTARHYNNSRSRVAFILFVSALIVLMTSVPTAAQQKASENRALYNSERVTTIRRGNMIDVARSSLFTDFTDNVRVTSIRPELQLYDTQDSGRLWRLMSGSLAPGSFYIFDNNAGAYRLTIDTSGNLGIGTTSPQYKLSLGASSDKLGFYSDDTHFNSIEFYNTNNGGLYFDQNTAVGGGYHWKVAHEERLTLTYEGNVGINLSPGSTPSEKLEVNGNLKLTGTGNIVAAGTINAKYQDVAEWVPSSDQLSAGTVVVLDSTKSNQVTSSSVSYDTRVAGVVSEQPGIALGEKSDTKVLVATTGRVRVKVDASKGPIHVGDLLVASDIPGVAVKSEPVNLGGVQLHRPGTLIGKALEPLEKGKGEILVLLSLR